METVLMMQRLKAFSSLFPMVTFHSTAALLLKFMRSIVFMVVSLKGFLITYSTFHPQMRLMLRSRVIADRSSQERFLHPPHISPWMAPAIHLVSIRRLSVTTQRLQGVAIST